MLLLIIHWFVFFAGALQSALNSTSFSLLNPPNQSSRVPSHHARPLLKQIRPVRNTFASLLSPYHKYSLATAYHVQLYLTRPPVLQPALSVPRISFVITHPPAYRFHQFSSHLSPYHTAEEAVYNRTSDTVSGCDAFGDCKIYKLCFPDTTETQTMLQVRGGST